MAEISTIARPYAEALLKAVKESKEEGLAQKLIPVLDTIDEIVADPKLKELASDPSLSSDQIYELIRGMLDKAVPQERQNRSPPADHCTVPRITESRKQGSRCHH